MINQSHSRLGLLGSLVLHGALFGGIWTFLAQPKPPKLGDVTSISLELIAARLEQPQVAVATESDSAPQSTEETALPEPEVIAEPEPQIKPIPLATPLALPKPAVKPKEKEKPKPKDPPKPKEKEKPKVEKSKAEKAKAEPKKSVKALEVGKEAKAGVIAKAIPNAYQGTKVQAGTDYGTTTQSELNKMANANEHNAYRLKLQRALQQRATHSYPQREKMMRKMGTVLLKFSLSSSGQISNVQVLKSSGNDNLDAAAVRAAQSTSAPPPPAGYPNALSVPVKFMVQ